MHQQKDGQIDLPRSSAGERKERRGRKEERKGRKGVFLEKKKREDKRGEREEVREKGTWKVSFFLASSSSIFFCAKISSMVIFSSFYCV